MAPVASAVPHSTTAPQPSIQGVTDDANPYYKRMLAAIRPSADVLAATPSARTAAQLSLTWGVTPVITGAMTIPAVRDTLRNRGIVREGDVVVFVSMHPKLGHDGRNFIHVEKI